MKVMLRPVVYLLIFLLSVGGSGTAGYLLTMQEVMSVYDGPQPSTLEVRPPQHDPNKPTVAVLLANEVTEVFDFLVPYEMFARTKAYNVYGVASDRKVKSLTGGLDVLPHYSFAEWDTLLGQEPDIVVIPYMPIMDEKKYQPVRDWIKKQAGHKTVFLTICNGAENLADVGLLDGRSAATHWGDIGRLEKKYKEVQWVRDQRYVVDGNIVSSAGLTSGMDATLFVISQQLGEAAALTVAEEMNYPSFEHVRNPQMEPYKIKLRDSVYLLQNAFQWEIKQAGVLLYEGVEEAALAWVFDTYSASGTTATRTIYSSNELVSTKHGLDLIARYTLSDSPKVEKMIVPGAEATTLAADLMARWEETDHRDVELLMLNSGASERFGLDAALEDLAQQEGRWTAEFAAKRLEYRVANQKLEGRALSIEPIVLPLLIGLISITIVWLLDRRFFVRR